MEIKTFIGRKLDYVNGILRRQIEIDRHLKNRNDIKLSYEYYKKPRNPIDFLSKRYVLYPYYSHYSAKRLKSDTVFHISFQNLGDLLFFLDSKRTFITCYDIFNFLEKNNIRNTKFVQKYALLGLKKCKYIVSISDFTKKELVCKFNIPKERIFVIKCAINHDIFKPIPQKELIEIPPLFPNHKKILHVGTEFERKDILTLFKAFYRLKKKYDKIKLIRVGPSRYPSIIKSLGLEKDIIYFNYVNNKKLREIYNLSDLLIFPSLYEGFGFPGLEAAACGLPVICSDIPIFREIYKDFPLYFPPQDYRTLGDLIIDNINDEEVKKDMSSKGLKVAKTYSWKKSAKKYLKLVNFIIANQ